jgi:hypothetical protein
LVITAVSIAAVETGEVSVANKTRSKKLMIWEYSPSLHFSLSGPTSGSTLSLK